MSEVQKQAEYTKSEMDTAVSITRIEGDVKVIHEQLKVLPEIKTTMATLGLTVPSMRQDINLAHENILEINEKKLPILLPRSEFEEFVLEAKPILEWINNAKASINGGRALNSIIIGVLSLISIILGIIIAVQNLIK